MFFDASCGFQAIARAAGVAAVVMTLLLVFVALTLLPEMEAIHFLSPFYEGSESVVRGALMELPRCLEAVSYTHLDVYKRQGRAAGDCGLPQIPQKVQGVGSAGTQGCTRCV